MADPLLAEIFEKMLIINEDLISATADRQVMSDIDGVIAYHQILHRNLIEMATLADDFFGVYDHTQSNRDQIQPAKPPCVHTENSTLEKQLKHRLKQRKSKGIESLTLWQDIQKHGNSKSNDSQKENALELQSKIQNEEREIVLPSVDAMLTAKAPKTLKKISLNPMEKLPMPANMSANAIALGQQQIPLAINSLSINPQLFYLSQLQLKQQFPLLQPFALLSQASGTSSQVFANNIKVPITPSFLPTPYETHLKSSNNPLGSSGKQVSKNAPESMKRMCAECKRKKVGRYRCRVSLRHTDPEWKT